MIGRYLLFIIFGAMIFVSIVYAALYLISRLELIVQKKKK